MKINVKVILDDQYRNFSISCGVGDKSFKWLALVVSERFANAAPNGTLRWRNDYNGISDRVQYSSDDIVLPSGEAPSASDLINHHLRDGDEVTMNLAYKQRLDKVTGETKNSEWGESLYKSSNFNDTDELSEDEEENDEEEDEDEGTSLGYNTINSSIDPNEYMKSVMEKRIEMNSGPQFMRLILKPQMINVEKVAHLVNQHMTKLSPWLPRLSPQDIKMVAKIFGEHYDILLDIFSNYSSGKETLSEDDVIALIEDSDIFSAAVALSETKKIFKMICNAAGATEFDITCFFASLILSAQRKFNDTLQLHGKISDTAIAVSQLITKFLVPMAISLNVKSILKREFCKDEFLSKLRVNIDELRLYFDTFAEKARDVPTTIPLEDFRHVLYTAALRDDKEGELSYVQKVTESVRTGTIYGREEPMEGEEPYEEDEVLFSEFVEGIARASFYTYHNKVGDDNSLRMSMIDSMLQGFNDVSTSIKDPNAFRKPVVSQQQKSRKKR